MKTILKYLFCSLLVLVYIHEGYGQQKRVVGPNIGYDVSQIAKGYFYPGYSAHVLSLDYEIDYLYYPVIEAGLFDLNKDQESMNYSSDGRFVKLGMDYNVIGIQGPWDYDMLFGGARIGVAQYNHSARDIVIENNYWGDYQADNIETNRLNALWLELVAGLKVEVLPNMFFGWSFRGQLMIAKNKDDNIPPYIIPGYGKGDNSINIGIQYFISYRFPIIKKDYKEPEQLF
ncbi:MAG: DUF6048 family protein [Bacteroidales bacterium]